MGKTIHIILALLLICIGCQRNTDTLMGNWKAEKVEVDFDERHSTPEIVKQTGFIEKENQLSLTEDSTLIFISQGDTVKGRFSVKEKQISVDGRPFGIIIENGIVTKENTPFGNITVTYQQIR